MQEVSGSIPLGSTISSNFWIFGAALCSAVQPCFTSALRLERAPEVGVALFDGADPDEDRLGGFAIA